VVLDSVDMGSLGARDEIGLFTFMGFRSTGEGMTVLIELA